MVTMRLVSKNRVPYGGMWNTRDRVTGVTLSATTFDLLLEKAKAARRAAGVPVGAGFADELEQWLCIDHPGEATRYDSRLPRKRGLGLMDIVHGTQVMGKFLTSGRKLVSEQEAEYRASVCAKCPWNVSFTRPCAGICRELQELVLSLTGNRGTRFDDKLRACFVCRCFLKSAVHLPLEVQCVGVTKEMREQFAAIRESGVPCWKVCEEEGQAPEGT